MPWLAYLCILSACELVMADTPQTQQHFWHSIYCNWNCKIIGHAYKCQLIILWKWITISDWYVSQQIRWARQSTLYVTVAVAAIDAAVAANGIASTWVTHNCLSIFSLYRGFSTIWHTHAHTYIQNQQRVARLSLSLYHDINPFIVSSNFKFVNSVRSFVSHKLFKAFNWIWCSAIKLQNYINKTQ